MKKMDEKKNTRKECARYVEHSMKAYHTFNYSPRKISKKAGATFKRGNN